MAKKTRRESHPDSSFSESEESSESEPELVVRRKKKKKPNPNKAKQLSIFGAGIEKIDPATQLNGSMTLLTDEIYGKKIPIDMKDQLFLYKIVAYNSESKEFTLKYQNRMITTNGGQWIDQDGGRDTMYGLKYETVKKGVKLHKKAEGRVASHNLKVDDVAKETLKAKVVSPEDVDMSDLVVAAQIDRRKGWHSQDVLDVSQIHHHTVLF